MRRLPIGWTMLVVLATMTLLSADPPRSMDGTALRSRWIDRSPFIGAMPRTWGVVGNYGIRDAKLDNETATFELQASRSAASAAAQKPSKTFTVTNLDDHGPGSLRQAISDTKHSHGADDIQFQAGLTGCITLTSGPVHVTHSVTIVGPGPGKLSISGNDACQVFIVTGTGTHVKLSGLSIVRGRAGAAEPRGGGILIVVGRVQLYQVVLGGNAAGRPREAPSSTPGR